MLMGTDLKSVPIIQNYEPYDDGWPQNEKPSSRYIAPGFKRVISGCRVVSLVKSTPPAGIAPVAY